MRGGSVKIIQFLVKSVRKIVRTENVSVLSGRGRCGDSCKRKQKKSKSCFDSKKMSDSPISARRLALRSCFYE